MYSINDVIKFYGKENQCRIAMEECGELIQAINKCLRYPDSIKARENLIEECVDVVICIAQLKKMFNITEEEYQKMGEEKYKRIDDRLKYDKNKSNFDSLIKREFKNNCRK